MQSSEVSSLSYQLLRAGLQALLEHYVCDIFAKPLGHFGSKVGEFGGNCLFEVESTVSSEADKSYHTGQRLLSHAVTQKREDVDVSHNSTVLLERSY